MLHTAASACHLRGPRSRPQGPPPRKRGSNETFGPTQLPIGRHQCGRRVQGSVLCAANVPRTTFCVCKIGAQECQSVVVVDHGLSTLRSTTFRWTSRVPWFSARVPWHDPLLS
eukprot:1192398-Prorocentrum_minimum.AAC.11